MTKKLPVALAAVAATLASSAPAMAETQATSGSGLMMQLAPIAVIFLVFYFLIIRPQSKKQKEHREMVSALGKGDKVMTSGGLIGNVTKLSDSEVTIKTGETEVVVYRPNIASVLESKGKGNAVDAEAPKKAANLNVIEGKKTTKAKTTKTTKAKTTKTATKARAPRGSRAKKA